MGEVERVSVDAALGLAEQTVHLVRLGLGLASVSRPCTFVERKVAQPTWLG